MKKILLLGFILVVVNSLFAFSKPQITSQNDESFLQERITYFEQPNLTDSCATHFSLFSIRHLRKSIINYFSLKDHTNFFSTQNLRKKSAKENCFFPPNSWVKFNLQTGMDYVTKKDSSYYFVYYGTKLQGKLGKNIRFQSDWWAGHFSGDKNYQNSALIDSWYQTSDDNKKLYLDNFAGKLAYQKKYWNFELGRGKHEIGSNIAGSVILSDAANDHGYFSARFELPEFYLSFMNSSLIPDSTASADRKDYAEKYLVVHQLGWKPNKNLHLFAGEEVIYGDRSIDLNYLLPFSFYRAIEHNLRDRDNVLIFAGMEWQYFPNLLLYGNFIFDELKKSEIFGNWWGNKYAFQIGNYLKIHSKIDFTFEFTAIRPWMYTHKILHDKFSHDDQPLGFPEGANLLQHSAELHWKIFPRFSFNIFSSYLRQGSVGNHFSINYQNRPSDEANWLEGEITDTFTFKPIITWQFLAHHHLKCGLISEKIDDEKFSHEIYLSYQTFY